MFSKFLFKIQDKLKYIYENSLFLQHIDNFILVSILAVFVVSTFWSSDYIGFIALVTIFLTFIRIVSRCGDKLSLNSFEIFLLAYFMLVVVSLAGSTLFSLSFKGFLKTFIYFGFYFSTAHYLKNNISKIPLIMCTIAACASFETFFAFVQNFAHVQEISTWQDVSNLNPEEVMTRVYGTLQPFNPNLLGGYFVVSIPALISMAMFFANKSKYKLALFFIVCSVLSIVALFFTGCRGAYIALFVILLLLFVLSAKFFWQVYKKIFLWVIASVVGIFTFVLCLFTSLRARLFSIFVMRNDSSNSFRFNVYQSSLQMFKDNWLLGIGVGNKNFREIYGLYMKTGFDALSAYNIFLEIAVESGIFALIAFLGFLFVCIMSAIKFICSSVDFEKIIFVAISAIAIIAVSVHGLVDTVFFRPQIQFVFWTHVAVISAYCYPKIANFTD